ncbi:MAG: PQQ-binding-like beta-propeller repeat protein, partial [Betaproteobacteria bacterium]|nr:PQQ-binding-like beta-propeller repeat protein [Betaproteobacteria bacterium]
HLRRDPDFRAEVAGPIYAQPLYWRFPGSAKALLLVATERNLVYALDAETGATAWKASLGPPVPRSSLPCGDIDPLGITGTPVIDERSQAMYLDAMVAGQSGGAPKHLIFALSLKDGSVLSGWPIDVEAALKASGKNFDAVVQNQRGALTVVGGTVYVPYGGHFGDCGDYRGWVVAVSLSAPHAVRSWSTRARGGGVWAAGGVSADSRAIYVATGNTIGARAWGDGEAVIRLGLDLGFSGKPRDFFAPADWQQLDAVDADLGGTDPLLVSLPGATPSELILALGKDGNAYLLDRQNLGGIGGGILVKKVSSDAIRTAPAYFRTAGEAFVAFAGRGIDCPATTRGDLTVLRIAAGSPPELSVAWCAEERGRGSPMITTTDGSANPIVWAVGAEGDNRLHGFRGDTGAVVFSGGGNAEAMGQVRRFQTLIAAGGRLYVAADQRIYAFKF